MTGSGAVWYAAISTCRGVHRCAAQVPDGLHPPTPAPTIEVMAAD